MYRARHDGVKISINSNQGFGSTNLFAGNTPLAVFFTCGRFGNLAAVAHLTVAASGLTDQH
jgi:hypothetical protein